MKKLLVLELLWLVLSSVLVNDAEAFFLLHKLMKTIYERVHPPTPTAPAFAPFTPAPMPNSMPRMPYPGGGAPFSASAASTTPGMSFSQTSPSAGAAIGFQPTNGSPSSSQYQPGNVQPSTPNSPAMPLNPTTPQFPSVLPTVTTTPSNSPLQPSPSPNTYAPITPRPTPVTPTITERAPTTPAAMEPESVSPTPPTPPTSAPLTRPPVTTPPRIEAPTREPEPKTTASTTEEPLNSESPSPPSSSLATTSPPATPAPTPSLVTPEPTMAAPTPQPTPEPTPQPTPEPTPQPTPEPTPSPTPQPTPQPTPEPTPPPTEPQTQAPPPPTPPPQTSPPPTPPPATPPPSTPPPPQPTPTPQTPASSNPGKGPGGNGPPGKSPKASNPPGKGPGGNGPPGKTAKCGEEEKKVMYRLYLEKKKDYDECSSATGGYTFPFGGTPTNEQMASLAKSNVCKNVLKEFSKTITTECELGDMPVRATAAKILYGTREDGAEDRDEDLQDADESVSELTAGESDSLVRANGPLLSSRSSGDTTAINVSNTVTGWDNAPAKDQRMTAATVHSDISISSVLPSEVNANLPDDADASASFTRSGQLPATPVSLKANTLAYTSTSASSTPLRSRWLAGSILCGVMYLFV